MAKRSENVDAFDVKISIKSLWIRNGYEPR